MGSRLSHLMTPTPNADVGDTPAWQYLSLWLDQLRLQNYANHTIKTYQTALIEFINFIDKDWRLRGNLFDCTKQDLMRFFGIRLEEDHIKLVSARLALSAISKFYQFLIKEQVVTHNPAAAYRLKTPSRKLPTIADESLIAQLLDQPMPDKPEKARLWVRDKAVFELLYSSGIRVSELVGLDLQDVDLATGVARIHGKGNKIRYVPIGSKAIAAIDHYLPHRTLWQEQNSSALFISERHGTRLSVRAVQMRLKVCAANAGIDLNLYPHLLRHCFASHILSSSGDLRAVQELLGHSNINTTQIYTHVDFGTLSHTYDRTHPRANLPKTTKRK